MARTFLRVLLWGVVFFPAWLLGGIPSRFHDFAHIGDGGGIRTIFLIMNQNPQSVTVTIRFLKDDGSPLILTLDGTTGSTINVVVPAGGMRKLATAATAPSSQAGWAQLTATAEVGAEVLFEISAGGQLVTQAAVESPGPVGLFDLFFEQTATTNSGIAIANLSTVGPVRIILTLKDENGNTVAVREITLVALGHLAQFISELFPQAANLRGTLRVQTSGPVSVITLQQTGLVLGTLPVVEIFF